MFVGLLPR